MLLALLLSLAPGPREVSVYPFTARLASYETRQYGFAARFAWLLDYGIAVTLDGQYDYQGLARDETAGCINKCRAIAEAPNLHGLMVAGAALLGAELRPFDTEIFFVDQGGAKLALVIGAGLGAVATRAQLKPPNAAGPATFADTGWRFAANFGAGFRVELGWVTLRLELRDLLFSSAMQQVNGCSKDDLKAMDSALRGGQGARSASLSGGCNVDRFDGIDADGRKRSDDVPLAFALVKSPSGELLNFVQLYVGLGLAF